MIRRGLMISLAAIVAMACVWLWAAAHVDPTATVPIHWGRTGADRFVSGAEALRVFWLFPLMAAAIALLFVVSARFEPFRRNLAAGSRTLLIAWGGSELLFVAIAVVFARAMTRSVPLGDQPDIWWRGVIAASFVLVVALADSLPKTRRNFMIGFRTRWTLTSDLAWEKTHRLAGRLLMLVGLWSIFAAFQFDVATLGVAITLPMLAVVALCTVYSYRVWRDDPNKRVGDVEHA
jgi:uncharacterized membrane protein